MKLNDTSSALTQLDFFEKQAAYLLSRRKYPLPELAHDTGRNSSDVGCSLFKQLVATLIDEFA